MKPILGDSDRCGVERLGEDFGRHIQSSAEADVWAEQFLTALSYGCNRGGVGNADVVAPNGLMLEALVRVGNERLCKI